MTKCLKIATHKFFLLIIFVFILAVLFKTVTFAQDATSSAVQDLQNKINDLQNKVSDLQGQEKTLSSQIGVMDNQIKLTSYKIDATKQQITNLTLDIDTANKKISTLEGSVDNLTKVLMNRIVATYEIGSAQPLELLITSHSASDLLERANYLRVAQQHDKKLIYDTVQAKNDFANQKAIYENEKKKIEALKTDLEAYNKQLDSQKATKQDLLTQTQGSEANYQRLLAQARAELSGFSRFVTSQGGASILSGQTSCDGWGCYYNQRDSQWGSIAINGQGGYSMAGYGCLITSIAMVASHMGHSISPGSIATSGGDNFSVGTAMLRFTINVGGTTISRSGISMSQLDGALQSGPVIVGIYAYGGTHFVVLKSGAGGNYIMNDPYLPGGHDVNFTDHYSLGSIFEIDKVNI